jgi:hypothetical protein
VRAGVFTSIDFSILDILMMLLRNDDFLTMQDIARRFRNGRLLRCGHPTI